MEYLRQGDFARVQRRARALYRKKAGILAEAVAKHLPQFRCEPPQGGFSLWLESSLSVDEQHLLEAAVSHGVSFDPGSAFRRAASHQLALRLCFSTTPESDLEQGVARLAKALSAIAPARGAGARSRH
jgi:DNA-binding transcriptional MocR family regulator